MAESTGVFICPECQAVVKGRLGEESGLSCPECDYQFGPEKSQQDGGIPAGARMPTGRSSANSGVIRNLTSKKAAPVKVAKIPEKAPMEAKPIEVARAEGANGSRDEEVIMPDGSRKIRRRKRRQKDDKNKTLVLFLFGWFCLVVLIFALFKKGDDKPEENPGDPGPTDLAVRNEAVMRRLLPDIENKFKEFLVAKTNDARLQMIDRPAELALAFREFYEQTSFPEPKSQVRRVAANVLSFSDETIAIETIWQDEDEIKWGAVHVFDKVHSWRLDWEAFAPHSTETWGKFRANLGDREGVFRLLVRKRLSSDERKLFSLSFYRAPRVFETDNEYKNTQSPEVEVETESDLGRQFLKLWNNYLEGKAPYGSILAKELDPEKHMRITVRLAWERDEDDDEFRMVLKEIIGVGWFGERIQELHAEELRKATDDLNKTVPEQS